MVRSQDSEGQRLLDAIRSEAFEKGRQKGIREGLAMARKKLGELVTELRAPEVDSEDQKQLEPVTLETDIAELDFRQRVFLSLKRAGINTVAELVGKNSTELLEFRGIGTAALKSIKDELALHGFSLKIDEPFYSRDPGDYA